MVLNTQLQLKWPNHSTHLLTGLKALFQNEQLVDCTLKCNKHSLKVHKSVLAACSPYFERELENKPSIVVKDVQFSVLQSLIEFMYYGETRISEDNLTSLIEAAKLFEVKGLSEMDLLASNENSIILSVVAVNGNGGSRAVVKSSSDGMENLVFDVNSQSAQLNTSHKNAQQSLPSTISSEDSEDSSSNLIDDAKDPSQPHACRNFVVTPPQTESAQILLSLARSYSEKQQLQSQLSTTVHQPDSHNMLPANVFSEQNFVVSTALTTPTHVTATNGHPVNLLTEVASSNDKIVPTNGESEVYAKYNGDAVQEEESNTSLLERLLTRTPVLQTPSSVKSPRYYEHYKNLYVCESSESAKNQNEADASKPTTNFTLQPAEAILEYPFLVQTNEGLVDPADMLNVFEQGEVFDPNTGSRTAIKFVPKESVLDDGDEEEENIKVNSMVDNHELEHIKRNTEDALKDDPEAVVLCKVNEYGQVEKYVLSSRDVNALKAMNERRKLEQRRQQQQQHVFGNRVDAPHIEVELPASNGGTSLITRIFSVDDSVENAISKLPFRKTTTTTTSLDTAVTGVENVVVHTSAPGDRMLDEATLTVDAHHHENMFEELDNQFSMDCSIEHIQREYGVYEEASKHESQLQLDHNYYANAMKDGEEECAVVISGDNYDLGAVMLIQEPSDGDLSLVALSNNNNNNNNNCNHNNNVNSSSNNNNVSSSNNNNSNIKNNVKRKCNANTSLLSSSSSSSTTPLNTFQIFATDGDIYLNGGGSERPPRRNGVIDKPIFNGKCDLILNTEELMSSVMSSTAAVINHPATASSIPSTTSTRTRATNCALDAAGVKSLRAPAKTKRRNSVNDALSDCGASTLPFKKVKNTTKIDVESGKSSRRTYRRRSTSLNEDQKSTRESHPMNGGFHLESNNLVEEILVDEVL